MTALDILVLFLIGLGGVFGFLRGFVQEVLALMAWVLVVLAVSFLHAPLTAIAVEPVGTEAGAAVLAFLVIAILTYALGRWIARSVGNRTRKSVLGPVDRVLGFGFGALKGLIGATLLFLLFSLAYDMVLGVDAERPGWLTGSRTFPLLSASGQAMSDIMAARRDDPPPLADQTAAP